MGRFCASSYRFRDIHNSISIRDLENAGEGHDVQHLQWAIRRQIQTYYLMAIVLFALCFTFLRSKSQMKQNSKTLTLKMEVKVNE